jgi:thiamine-phosphate pyrophosphorylase
LVTGFIDAGVDLIQLRDKQRTTRELVQAAEIIKKLTRPSQSKLIINDRVDIAKAVEADGVHLGQDDLEIGAARRILGHDMVIGISTHSVQQAFEAQKQGPTTLASVPSFPL